MRATAQKERQRIWKTRCLRFWREWVRPLLVIVVLCYGFRSAVADWNDVPTGSMKPTIVEGDRIFVNKLAYDLKFPFTTWHVARWGDPKPGDVVVCFSPADGTRLVKRVIGIPGDRVAMQDNVLLINDQALCYKSLHGDTPGAVRTIDERLLLTEAIGDMDHAVMITPARPAPRSFDQVIVPQGQFLVLGDNRDNSADSRFFGFVPRDQIVGSVPGVVFSLDPDRWYLPRWDRTLSGID